MYVTGRFRDTVDFDSGTGTDDRISNGGSDIFLIDFDNAGSYVWTITMGGTGDDQGADIAFNSSSVR